MITTSFHVASATTPAASKFGSKPGSPSPSPSPSRSSAVGANIRRGGGRGWNCATLVRSPRLAERDRVIGPKLATTCLHVDPSSAAVSASTANPPRFSRASADAPRSSGRGARRDEGFGGGGPGPGGRRDAREAPTTLSSPPAGTPPPSSSPSASSPGEPSRTSGSSPGARSAHATTGVACAPRNSRTHFPLDASQSNALPSLCPASTHRDAFAANEAEEEPPEAADTAPSKREDATEQNASAETVAPGVGTPIATHSRRPPSSDDARMLKVFFFSRPIPPAGRSGGPRG
jgi:hypothetical protein